METSRITEEKLNRKDYFRAQVQFKKRDDKIVWAAEYGFIAERYPEIAEKIRDDTASEIKKRLKHDFNTILKSNNKAPLEFDLWLMQNVVDSKLQKEVSKIVNKA